MATNVADLSFNETDSIYVRIYTTTGGSTTYDIEAIEIDFSSPNGVTVVWENEPNTHSKTFFPYSTIQQIFQVA